MQRDREHDGPIAISRGRPAEPGAPATFLSGGGQLGAAIRSYDWANSPLGRPEAWPASLKTAVNLMLGAAQPVYIGWGPELISLYNDGYLPIVGSKHPDGLGKPFRELWEEIWPEFEPLVAKTLHGEAQYFVDMPVALAGRAGIPVGYFTFSYTPMRNDQGDIEGLYCAATESTDRVLAEARFREISSELADREGQLRAAITDSPASIAIFDRDMRYIAASRGYVVEWGLSDKAYIGVSHYELFPNLPERWLEVHQKALAGEEFGEERDPIEHEGDLIWVRWQMNPWRTDSGEIGGAVIFSEIITRQVEEERRLREAQERYRAVFDHAAVGIARVDPAGIFIEVNDRFCEIAGWPRDELVRTGFPRITHPDDLQLDLDRLRACLRGDIPSYWIEKRYVRQDGGVVWVDLTVSLIRDASGDPDYLVAVIQDISEKKRAEEELGRAIERGDLAQMAVRSAVYEYFPATGEVIRSANHPVVGFGVEEIGRGVDGWRRLLHPEDIELFERKLAAAMDRGDTYALEYRARHKDGRWVWIADNARLIRDPDGKVERWVGLVTDITERKEAEEREHLLAREVDHRAKNLLAVVQSIVHLTRAGDGAELKTRIQGRIQALARAHSLLSQSRWEGVNLGELVGEELEPYLELEDPRAECSGPQVRLRPAAAQSIALVLHELATNAAKYGSLSTDDGRLAVHWTLSDGDMLTIDWRETGGPPTSQPRNQGFGTKIIRSTVERQLKGTLERRWLAEGMRCCIRLPVDEALASTD